MNKSRVIITILLCFSALILITSCKSSGLTQEEKFAAKEAARKERNLNRIRAAEAKDAPVSSMEELLKRQANVVVTGSGNNLDVQIRGKNSLTANTQPLYVLDGRRLGHSFQLISHINPGDVKRINIVRDPAELAAYGLGASAGVVEVILIKR